MSQKKRKTFSIEEKSRIISKLDSGIPNKDIAKEYGVKHSTISTIWKGRHNIKKMYDSNFLKMKKARRMKHTNVEEALLKWFKIQRRKNILVTGPILQEKANEFARRFGEDFVCSPSWIYRFRSRHDILHRQVSGKPDSTDDRVVQEWISQKWLTLSEDYGPDNIFNADETGLFYNMAPNWALKWKGEDCSGGEIANQRLTILVATNMTGSSKKKLLVVGKFKKPTSFENLHSLPVTYESNMNSWMTSEIFERWLRNWDAELQVNNKKILLLVNDCNAHNVNANLKCIKLAFLPLNITSTLRPLDQGVMRCLKYHYKRQLVIKSLQNFNIHKQNIVTVLDAILMLSDAWQKVSQRTIADCFNSAGFRDPLTISLDDDDEPWMKTFSTTDNDEEYNIPLAQLANLSDTELEEFINVDNSLAICAPAMEDDIVQVKEEIEEEEDIEEEFTVPTLNDGLNAINVLRKIVLCNDQFNTVGNYNNALIKIQRELENSFARQNSEQTNITIFMKTE
ncbi:hypothetical protein K1T71_010000 [Dendrolimus kikuchii]|uniref:Uncharacterized protein n=1 Tax=Dendrolimus kikuchii TaxID=765133 RepID=A0ACC1CUB2_9NEOP|nr:hypothetical protein K1T71_010000 [Dendrolimus kikuchii]